MANFFKKVGNNFLDLLYPKGMKCIFCEEEIMHDLPHETCEVCYEHLPFCKGKRCKKCGAEVFADAEYCMFCKTNVRFFDLASSPFYYKDEIALAIQGFKYDNKKYLFEPLAYYMAKEYYEHNIGAQYIIPVPLHSKRLKERGYNQAELLGKYLSKFIDVPLNTECLIKVRGTKSQTKLNYEERQTNLENAFKVINKKEIKGKNILLIDDVFTTGSTLTNCSKVLKEAGVNKIFALTLARTGLEEQKSFGE